MRRRAGALAVAAALGAGLGPDEARGGRAPSERIALPGADHLPSPPPLSAPGSAPRLPLLPRGATIGADSTVHVALARGGDVRRIVVLQRLTVRGTGDYAFSIPAPATDVVGGAVSESEPGFRPGEIIWQGFSPGRRTLAARAALRSGNGEKALPLRVSITGAPTRRGPFTVRVEIADATAVRTDSLTAVPSRADAVALLRRLRRAAAAGRALATPPAVDVSGGIAPRRVLVGAAVALRGVLAWPAGAARVDAVRLDGRALPASQEIRLRGVTGVGGRRRVVVVVSGFARHAASPRLRFTATPVPARALPPRVDREAGARELLETAADANLRLERTLQYGRYLVNPDPGGRSVTTYVYESAGPTASAPGAARPAGSDRRLPLWLGVAIAVLGAAGLLVLWAHL